MTRPLAVRARVGRWSGPRLVKVAGLDELASGHFPLERMVLDARSGSLPPTSNEALFALPWAGMLSDDTGSEPAAATLVVSGHADLVRHGDVFEISSKNDEIGLRYRRGDTGNVLFATERCNSYCLMCSQPPRQVDDRWRVEYLMNLIELIDKDEPEVAISGGEPTLLGDGLLEVVAHCARCLPCTRIHILSNGRLLARDGAARRFTGTHPALSWGVPLYGDTYDLHDYVVQSRGAFDETIRGLYALHRANQHIELRVVLVRPTVERLKALARYIYRNLSFAEHIAFMGMEPIGFAKGHRDALWIDPADAAPVLHDVVEWLSDRGMTVSLYNLPLCALPSELWRFAQQSISTWKQTYLSACEHCAVKQRCAGFFSWTTPAWTTRVLRPFDEVPSCTSH